MSFIPTPYTARCALRYELFGEQVVNTLWFKKTSATPATGIELAGLANQLSTWAVSNILPLLSTAITLVDITATAQDDTTAPSTFVTVNEAGTVVDQSMPGNVCFTVKFSTTERGRSARGRNYVGGIPRGVVTGDLVDTTFANDLLSAYGLLLTIDEGVWFWAVVSHFTSHLPRLEGRVLPVIAPQIPNRKIDTQRRRVND